MHKTLAVNGTCHPSPDRAAHRLALLEELRRALGLFRRPPRRMPISL